MDPAGFGYFLDDGVPLNATGDFALGLDYMLYASGIGATLDPIIYSLILDPILYGGFPLVPIDHRIDESSAKLSRG